MDINEHNYILSLRAKRSNRKGWDCFVPLRSTRNDNTFNFLLRLTKVTLIMIANNSNFYQVGASLPVDARSYVKRQADEEFYQKLQAGKFCYVLNSRQMGKSSLRVQTMQRLQKEGTVCAAIDLTGIGKVTEEQWYGGIVYNLSESCQLEDKFNFDWQVWWQKHQTILSPVQCLNQFIEKVLLAKIQQPIVIFVDEIDKVLSQNFSLDDFFALIRFFQNQRVDNPIFERLTFALLGVATPGDLITNKTQTPFNIGEAIELHGFQIDEVESLMKGLEGRFDSPQKVMAEILHWTGGQPFLTQKLCQFMVEESEKDNPRSVKEVVKSKIIENWESQDNPEHLRTIRDRIISSEQRAGYLLELYQQIQQQGEVAANNSVESSELRLSGLVVQRQGKLRVYNQIYQQVFNQNWVETQLKNLRPYSEAFRAWVASGFSDESRLLQGKALESAEKWAKGKDLSFQDKQFLAASKEKEIAVRNQEAELERERKDREAAEQRNFVLSEANVKAKRRIRNGTVVLIFTLAFTAISSFVAANKIREASKTDEYLGTVEKLANLAGELEDEGSNSEAKELFSQAGQSVNIKNHQLRQAVLYAGISYAYQKLKSKDLRKAQDYLKKSQQQLEQNSSNEALQVRLLTLKTQANLFQEQEKPTIAIIAKYKKAFGILNRLKEKGKRGGRLTKISPAFNPNIQIRILSKQNLEALHREFIALLSKNNNKNLKSKVKESLKEHYLDELNNLLANKKWGEADIRTSRLMLYVANIERKPYFDIDIKNVSCKSLQDIDSLWLQHSDRRFGFSVQKKIWAETGNRLGITRWTKQDEENYLAFASVVGWYDKDKNSFYGYSQLVNHVEKNYEQARVGILPFVGGYRLPPGVYDEMRYPITASGWEFFSRVATCQL